MNRFKIGLLGAVNWTIHRLLDWQKAIVRAEVSRLGGDDPFAECCPQVVPVSGEEGGPLSRLTLTCSECKGTGEASDGWPYPDCYKCGGRGSYVITLDRRSSDANL